MRAAVKELGSRGEEKQLECLENLWRRGSEEREGARYEVLSDPVVRLVLAQILLENGKEAGGAYVSYIKDKAYSRNWVVRSNAADALAAVGDLESIELLQEIAKTPHRLVALRAVWSLERLHEKGVSRDKVLPVVSGLVTNPIIKDEEVKKVLRRVYEDISREQLEELEPSDESGKEGFVALEEIGGGDDAYEGRIKELEDKAKAGDVEAQHTLGEFYLLGVHVNKNYSEALKWLSLSAQKGFAPAKTSLANMYLSGRGVEENREKAVRLLLDAKNQGYAPARRMLRILEKGR